MADTELLGSRYEVLRVVSEGRAATVLQALDHVHDRLVALKVYPAHHDGRSEFLAEARLLMSIGPHPALPVVRGDFFTEDGDRYVLVMNWVEGTNLQQVLEEQGDPGLPFHEVVEALSDVAGALDHLHAHDPPIIHGDVKPSNLVQTTAGRVVLVDFDIAGAHAGQGRIGSVGYVAPEVVAGEKPGAAGDVFGLGATAVALLTGQPPMAGIPQYHGMEPAEQAQLARVLRGALAIDPTRRPRSAGRFVENLRAARGVDHPSGVVALLAAEVFEATRLWSEDPEEMRTAMVRLRDVRDDVVTQCNGRVMTSMNEGDRTIAVFREASNAVLAALALHERVAAESFPPGFEVRLRAAVAVGEATLVDGVYTGAIVDHVLGLRSVADPGTTLTTESTAELLVGLVGHGASIVPLGPVVSAALPRGGTVFGLTRPGDEHSARLGVRAEAAADVSAPAAPAAETESAAAVSRRTLAAAAIQQPTTLVPLTVAGLALIFLMILSPELGLVGVASAALVVGAICCVGSFAWHYSLGKAESQRRADEERSAHEREDNRRSVERERAESRNRLRRGLTHLDSDDARDARQVLDGLADEFDATAHLLQRTDSPRSVGLSSVLPDLSDETYRHGMSALSDALELLESADGAQRRRLEATLREVDDRLERDAYADDRARVRDQQRRVSQSQVLARHDESRQRARDLVFEAERCSTSLAEARIELASMRAGDAQIDVDAVVQTLQATIRRVRDVQVEMRRLGY